MERVRSPRPSEDSAPETIEPLPGASSLPALLEAVRSPGVLRKDVDALLRGLALPLDEAESPRARADLLLSLIESRDVHDMRGSDGRTVRGTAVQALLDLGYPYALELPPEALDDALRAQREAIPRQIPTAGLIATSAGLAVQTFEGLPGTAELLNSGEGVSTGIGLLALTALLGPALSATIGGWFRVHWLQRLGLLTMALTGSLWLAPFAGLLGDHTWSPTATDLFTSLTAGLGFLGGAFLMRRPEWLAAQEAPDAGKALPTEAPETPP